MAQQELSQLSGTVEGITYHNEETGFTVMLISVGDELVTVVGETPAISEGEEIAATGFYTTHTTYGTQFKAQIIERTLPSTANAILRYLSSGAIKGVGPAMAKKLVGAFGDATMEVIEKNPERLTQVRGISPNKAESIAQEYQRLYGIRSLMILLGGYGIQAAESIKIWKKWGNNAGDIIARNPYCLCGGDIGLDFGEADKIAEEQGISQDSSCRLAAGIAFVLRHNSQSGHVCLPRDKLIAMTSDFLEVAPAPLEDMVLSLTDENTLAIYNNGGREFVYLYELYAAESYIAGRVSLMLQLQCPVSTDLSGKIAALEQELGIEYDELQRQAVQQAAESNVFILTGGPGTGKTTTLNGILTLLERQGNKVALAAPTGRAAKRMTEVTGREARTIHRLLEVEPERGVGITFKRNEKNTLPADVIIVDEMSMVDTIILDALLRGMKLSCKLILVGDSDQLPSVSAGNVLKDMIDSSVIPMVHLDRVFRQAAQSLIVRNAHAIVAGELPELDKKDSDFFFLRRSDPIAVQELTVDLCARRLPASYHLSPMWDIQVIVPGKKGPVGTQELNRCLQEALNPTNKSKTQASFFGRVFREGDKVMQIRNNYDVICKTDTGEDTMGIFNGDIGVIEMMDVASKTILVRFDDRVAPYSFENADQLELAYAITIHKSQGSEFEAVVMPLMNRHPKLHYRNLLYTGVTRARRLLVMAGSPDTVAEMVANCRRTLRYTNLRDMLGKAVSGSANDTFGG